MIVFLVYKLLLSPLALAGFGRQAIVKIPLLTLAKGPRASDQMADNKSIIDDDPGPIAIFSLRFRSGRENPGMSASLLGQLSGSDAQPQAIA